MLISYSMISSDCGDSINTAWEIIRFIYKIRLGGKLDPSYLCLSSDYTSICASHRYGYWRKSFLIELLCILYCISILCHHHLNIIYLSYTFFNVWGYSAMAGEPQVRHRESHRKFEIPCTPAYKIVLKEKLLVFKKHLTGKLKTSVNNAYIIEALLHQLLMRQKHRFQHHCKENLHLKPHRTFSSLVRPHWLGMQRFLKIMLAAAHQDLLCQRSTFTTSRLTVSKINYTDQDMWPLSSWPAGA